MTPPTRSATRRRPSVRTRSTSRPWSAKIEQAIADGADGIITCPLDPAAFKGVIDEAKEAASSSPRSAASTSRTRPSRSAPTTQPTARCPPTSSPRQTGGKGQVGHPRHRPDDAQPGRPGRGLQGAHRGEVPGHQGPHLGRRQQRRRRRRPEDRRHGQRLSRDELPVDHRRAPRPAPCPPASARRARSPATSRCSPSTPRTRPSRRSRTAGSPRP